MLIQYSRRAQRALIHARSEAGRRGTEIVSPEHLLLALLADTHCVARRVVDRLGDGADALRDDLLPRMARPDGDAGGGPRVADADTPLDLIPMTEDAERAVGFARDESRRAQEASVGTGHLLAGLLAQSAGPAAQTLARHGVDLERVRQEMAREQEP